MTNKTNLHYLLCEALEKISKFDGQNVTLEMDILRYIPFVEGPGKQYAVVPDEVSIEALLSLVGDEAPVFHVCGILTSWRGRTMSLHRTRSFLGHETSHLARTLKSGLAHKIRHHKLTGHCYACSQPYLDCTRHQQYTSRLKNCTQVAGLMDDTRKNRRNQFDSDSAFLPAFKSHS